MDRLVRHPTRNDSVQFYNDLAPLMSEMGRILCVALDQGHAAVCIVSEPTRLAFEDQLNKRGIDVAAVRDRQSVRVSGRRRNAAEDHDQWRTRSDSFR